ncbi:MAG: hypothetical protein PHW53_04445 [Patescibacteria group bacterium]|nr:hypothetical protein [Patescibacteria group bacterium]
MNPFFASAIAFLVATLLCVALVLIRSVRISDFFRGQVAGMQAATSERVRIWGVIFAVGANIVFALGAALVFRYMISQYGADAKTHFMAVAGAFVLLFTFLAVLTRKRGMVIEKISLNLIFGIIYGVLIPLLSY